MGVLDAMRDTEKHEDARLPLVLSGHGSSEAQLPECSAIDRAHDHRARVRSGRHGAEVMKSRAGGFLC